jgi:hypothetical protein
VSQIPSAHPQTPQNINVSNYHNGVANSRSVTQHNFGYMQHACSASCALKPATRTYLEPDKSVLPIFTLSSEMCYEQTRNCPTQNCLCNLLTVKQTVNTYRFLHTLHVPSTCYINGSSVYWQLINCRSKAILITEEKLFLVMMDILWTISSVVSGTSDYMNVECTILFLQFSSKNTKRYLWHSTLVCIFLKTF